MALFPPKNPAPAPAPIPMPAAARPTTLSAEDIARARNIGSQIRGRFAQTLVGQDNLRESLITTLVAGGHILIESVPGLAKTTAAQTLATSVSGSFKTCAMHSRSDAFGPGRHSGLRFRHAEILHADRPDPRQFRAARRNQSFQRETQSAMLEAMRRARPPSEANASRCRNHSWSSQRRIQSRKRAPSIFPRRRWTVS